ncbi:MAG: hypothetical protein ACE5I5_16415 [Candidatus Heimdallarchaeota archaeon]
MSYLAPLGSKVGVKVITFIIEDFARYLVANEFSVRQLAKRVGCSKDSISRIIRPLADEDFLFLSNEKNAFKIRLNPQHPLIVKLLELKMLHGQDKAMFKVSQEAKRKLQGVIKELEAERRRTASLLRRLEHIRKFRTSSVSEFSARLIRKVIELLREEAFGSEIELIERLGPLVAEELRAEFPFLWRE